MATYPSNLIQAGGGEAAPSIVPGTLRPVVGSVLVPAGVTLAANDTLPLFSISTGGGAHIFSVFISSVALDTGATLTMSLVDSSTPTPNVIIAPSNTFRAGGVLTDAQVGNAAIGAAVSYTASNLLQLLVNAAAGAAIPVGGARIYFNIGISAR